MTLSAAVQRLLNHTNDNSSGYQAAIESRARPSASANSTSPDTAIFGIVSDPDRITGHFARNCLILWLLPFDKPKTAKMARNLLILWLLPFDKPLINAFCQMTNETSTDIN